MSEKKKTRHSYSAEFKAEAVAKCLISSISQTSRELGVSTVTLSSWISQSKRGPVSSDKPSYNELEQEVARLKKELGYVSEINRILKKSTAIFSMSEMGDLR